jgi:hypothetical protein
MTTSANTITAQAFRFMEMGPISSFGDDTEEARSAAEQYPVALEMCLEAADWGFASVYANLPARVSGDAVAGDPALPFLYNVPGDLVRIHEVGDGYTRWRLDRDVLRADMAAPLPIRYTGRIVNEAALPAAFRTVVALHLAVLLGPRWLGTQGKMDALKRDAMDRLKIAMRQTARSASEARYDGLADQGDWVHEARQ